ncbi:unnamed protein product [Soboliphyme baturini]|uniref:NADH dehydrogenase [ubiquinone] 1 beta subcomplex subunit 11, mitochondrial n=1 Tax=Soboliphyme baturini TaxID=241478 RepID=A0A183ITC3_9BILA|nr:unnamed protein product [Soboliphyme baturini]
MLLSCHTKPFTLPVLYHLFRPNLREWAFREAYMEMERREKLGLPYISKDLIDPEKVKLVLPTDEELGDFEIIV